MSTEWTLVLAGTVFVVGGLAGVSGLVNRWAAARRNGSVPPPVQWLSRVGGLLMTMMGAGFLYLFFSTA